MKRTPTILISVIAALMATASLPAKAIENGDVFSSGDSNGPYAPFTAPRFWDEATVQPVACRVTTETVQAPTCGPVAGTGWSPFESIVITKEELAAQQRANERWQHEAFDHANREGRATGNMPVAYATQYWNCTVGSCTGPDGATRPVGASSGD